MVIKYIRFYYLCVIEIMRRVCLYFCGNYFSQVTDELYKRIFIHIMD